ncbi:reverse transcriptase domain-containing protein [Chryseobacterium luteum]|uniref:Reverse transcriptase domain-containing protein n=1 Tax=Chryseobacterium luteum TaxID=421531 RepID=A0A085ZT93_9FLAO|nr:reverse transcriptase domain-containing protein [Chryseobacterium luteum]KFF07657.1 hypothetical protein IX38_09590 [Chryseobacterium luteum]
MKNEKKKLEKPEWFKVKGYLHLTPNINSKFPNWITIANQIKNPNYISKYCFFPLIHNIILERRYKHVKQYNKFGVEIKDADGNTYKKRSHKEYNPKLGTYQSTAKARPIHYASHKDSLIFSYYSHLLNEGYKKILTSNTELDKSVTAYRKIVKIDEVTQKEIGKSTIDFAFEIFEEIKNRAKDKDIAVLAFDIEKFFSSLNHQKLKEKWNEVMQYDSNFSCVDLNKDHFRVYKATTDFSYVLLDDLRVSKKHLNGKKAGFNESKLAHIRKKEGFKCFFESNQDFRNQIRQKKLKVYKNPFWDKDKKIKKGIPQGLPISATLANIYLLDFDRIIIEKLVSSKMCYYRRYSDDIIIICNPDEIELVKEIVEKEMQNNLVSISKEKTETFIFKHIEKKLVSHKLAKKYIDQKEVNIEIPYSPLKYLGFEFRGYNINIKSANISKFYRKLINVVKRRARRAKFAKAKDPFNPKTIFINQIKKLYNSHNKKFDKDSYNKKQRRKKYNLKYNSKKGFFEINHISSKKTKRQSNYSRYVERSSDIMNELGIKKQIRKQKNVLFRAINKHLNKS